jgi:hypothetical protein
MNKPDYQKLLNHRIKRMAELIRCLRNSMSEDKIHKFRVEVKKLSALGHACMPSAEQENRLHFGHAFTLFYHTLGNSRNFAMHLMRIEHFCNLFSFNTPSMYIADLQAKLQEEHHKAMKLIDHVSLKKVQRKICGQGKWPEHAANMFPYVLSKKMILRSLIESTPYTDEGIHCIRKQIKEILYNFTQIKMLLKNELPAFFCDKDSIIGFGERLGAFHDLCADLAYLYPDRLRSVPEDERIVLEAFRNDLQLGRELLKTAIERVLLGLQSQLTDSKTIKMDEPLLTSELAR